MSNLHVQNIATSLLIPYARNARIHSSKQIQQISNSIQKFGFLVPVLIDDDNTIIAGHGRVMAAQKLKMANLPCIQVSHLNEAEKRAYIIADNKLTENADWNLEILGSEFKELSDLNLDFDLDITGFHNHQIDLIIEDTNSNEKHSNDIEPQYFDLPSRCQLGDVWELGDHRILCANSLEEKSFKELLGKRKAQMVITDPPYNVPIDGHVCGSGSIKHEEFSMASGELSTDDFVLFLQKAFEQMRAHSKNGSIHYIFMDWRHIAEITTAGSQYDEFKNMCVWAKDNAGMGSFYRSQHELIFVFKNGTGQHINNFELGQDGRYRTNVWQYAGITNIHARKEGDHNLLSLHPTVKPIDLIEDAIRDCSKRNGIVLDPFLGSGSTLLACEQSGRKCFGIELEPKYVDVCIARWENKTGKSAQKIKSVIEEGENV